MTKAVFNPLTGNLDFVGAGDELLIPIYCTTFGGSVAAGELVSFIMPVAMTVTSVYATAKTAPTGANMILDVNEGGTSILGTKITIEATEFDSRNAASQPAITDSSIAQGATVSVDCDQKGATVAGADVIVYLSGRLA